MIEYLILAVLLILFLKPMKIVTIPGKIMLLGAVLYITTKNPVLGIAAALLVIQILPVDAIPIKKIFPSRLPLDESMRPKNSKQITVSRQTSIPPSTQLISDIPQEVKPTNTGNYTPF